MLWCHLKLGSFTCYDIVYNEYKINIVNIAVEMT